MNLQTQITARNQRSICLSRLFIGLCQGILLYGLYYALQHKLWPTTQNELNFSSWAVVLLVPLIIIQAMSSLRLTVLLTWGSVATLLIAGVVYYATWCNPGPFQPSPNLVFLIFALFIAHTLIVAGSIDHRFKANYSTYFDVSWKICIQFLATAIFLWLFWTVLKLGSYLFELLGVDFLSHLIKEYWFSFPLITFATALGLHLSDGQFKLIRNIRAAILFVLSWLLLPLTFLVTVFLVTHIFVGFKPLSRIDSATLVLSITIAVLIILLNAAYQDGSNETMPVKVLRYCCRIAALAIMPLTILAIYAMYLRVAQYGWTDSRILIAAYLGIAALYAGGYFFAACCRWQKGFKLIETWNFVMALVVLAVLLALITPAADPARLAVNSQLSRLKTGVVPADKFDFAYLATKSKRFGREAITKLQPHYPQAVKSVKSYPYGLYPSYKSIKPEALKLIKVHNASGHLPESFIHQAWDESSSLPSCNFAPCEGWMVDLNGDGQEEILIQINNQPFKGFQQNAAGVWQVLPGNWLAPISCISTVDKREGDQIKIIAPLKQVLPDIKLMGKPFRYQAPYVDDPLCVKAKH